MCPLLSFYYPGSSLLLRFRQLSAVRQMVPVLCLATILVVSTQEGFAQAGSITGYPPFVTIQGDIDAINAVNLNVHLEVPVLHKAGRKLPFDYNMSYDSTVYYPSGGKWTPVPNWGWRGVTETAFGYMTANIVWFNDTDFEESNFAYHDNRGTVHSFGNLVVCDNVNSYHCPTSESGSATDGSGYFLTLMADGQLARVHVYNPSGNWLDFSDTGTIFNGNPPTDVSTGLIDPQGDFNWSSVNGGNNVTFGDTFSYPVLTVNGTNPRTYQYTGPNSSNQTVTVNYTSYTVKTSFVCSGMAEYGPTAVSLVSSINMPDGTSYTFQYETNGSYYTGRVAQIGLPTGGTISYQYTGGSHGIDLTDLLYQVEC